ncbi:hypothetical protein SDC9_77598 [bioreactor metagenome]|uniref:FecR protein domain-containing protein n=1 Tax=bioreactor metagenome TaxID=1076179 RepID=A0A644YR34_9ZZZZ|nr:FecR domain-containing protein [Rikenellaceae bacterium]
MHQKYKEELERAEQIASRIIEKDFYDLEGIEKVLADDYQEHRDSLNGLNLDRIWLRMYYRRYVPRLIAVASAAVIVVMVSLLFVLPDNVDQTYYSETTVILPAEGQITLKLSDGSMVSVDSIKKELETTQGIVYDQNAQVISYDVKSNGQESKEVAEQKYNELFIPKGRSFSLVLSDGSKVWLNAESYIKYPVAFSGGIREVYIEGEAFFDVQKENGNQFVVKTKDYSVKVLGTKFNINTYDQEAFAATTLVEGAVAVSGIGSSEIKIRPGEQLRYDRNSGGVEQFSVDVELYTSWVDNKLKLEEMRLEEMFNILMRRYDIELFYSDEEVKDVKFTGRIPLNENLNVILDQISAISEVEFGVEKRLIVIRKKD